MVGSAPIWESSESDGTLGDSVSLVGRALICESTELRSGRPDDDTGPGTATVDKALI